MFNIKRTKKIRFVLFFINIHSMITFINVNSSIFLERSTHVSLPTYFIVESFLERFSQSYSDLFPLTFDGMYVEIAVVSSKTRSIGSLVHRLVSRLLIRFPPRRARRTSCSPIVVDFPTLRPRVHAPLLIHVHIRTRIPAAVYMMSRTISRSRYNV